MSDELDELLPAGTPIGDRYVTERLIGRGGFAFVYLARHRQLESLQIAIKVMRSELAEAESARRRFVREGHAVARLTSPHVVRVSDAGQLPDGRPWLAMEFCAGFTLDALLQRRGRMRPFDVARYARQVLLALEEAHALGIVHRDLKPENVFVVPGPHGGEPVIKVGDFGIARVGDNGGQAPPSMTVTGGVLCTPVYASPELLLGDVQPASDLYALGHMMAELLEGHAPYSHISPIILVCAEHLQTTPVPLGPHVSQGPLAGIVRKAVQKPLELRYRNAREMRDALDAVLATLDGAEDDLTYVADPDAHVEPPSGSMASHLLVPTQLAVLDGLDRVRLPLEPTLEVQDSGLDTGPFGEALLPNRVLTPQPVAKGTSRSSTQPGVVALPFADTAGMEEIPDAVARIPRREAPEDSSPVAVGESGRARRIGFAIAAVALAGLTAAVAIAMSPDGLTGQGGASSDAVGSADPGSLAAALPGVGGEADASLRADSSRHSGSDDARVAAAFERAAGAVGAALPYEPGHWASVEGEVDGVALRVNGRLVGPVPTGPAWVGSSRPVVLEFERAGQPPQRVEVGEGAVVAALRWPGPGSAPAPAAEDEARSGRDARPGGVDVAGDTGERPGAPSAEPAEQAPVPPAAAPEEAPTPAPEPAEDPNPFANIRVQ